MGCQTQPWQATWLGPLSNHLNRVHMSDAGAHNGGPPSWGLRGYASPQVDAGFSGPPRRNWPPKDPPYESPMAAPVFQNPMVVAPSLIQQHQQQQQHRQQLQQQQEMLLQQQPVASPTKRNKRKFSDDMNVVAVQRPRMMLDRKRKLGVEEEDDEPFVVDDEVRPDMRHVEKRFLSRIPDHYSCGARSPITEIDCDADSEEMASDEEDSVAASAVEEISVYPNIAPLEPLLPEAIAREIEQNMYEVPKDRQLVLYRDPQEYLFPHQARGNELLGVHQVRQEDQDETTSDSSNDSEHEMMEL